MLHAIFEMMPDTVPTRAGFNAPAPTPNEGEGRDAIGSSTESRDADVSHRSWSRVWSRPLPSLKDQRATRFWIRCFLMLFGGRIRGVHGMERLGVDQGPYILVMNHSQRLEALLIPALLAWWRGGRMVHFMTDWLVMLYPGVASVVKLHGPIYVTRKNAKMAWMNRFREKYVSEVPPFEQARQRLMEGGCVGIFVEGTMNRDRDRLLRGFSGAAQLAVDSGCPVIAVGIRFERGGKKGPIGDLESFTVEVGERMEPPPKGSGISEIRDWHGQIMRAISHLSGKSWTAENQRTRYVT